MFGECFHDRLNGFFVAYQLNKPVAINIHLNVVRIHPLQWALGFGEAGSLFRSSIVLCPHGSSLSFLPGAPRFR